MYLVRSYFALSSLHLLRNSSISFTQKGVRIIYCESSIIPLPFYAPINQQLNEGNLKHDLMFKEGGGGCVRKDGGVGLEGKREGEG